MAIGTTAALRNNNSAHPDAKPQAETPFEGLSSSVPELHQGDATMSHGYLTFRTQGRQIRPAIITSKSLEVEWSVHVPETPTASGRGIIVPYLPIPITPVRDLHFCGGHHICIAFARNKSPIEKQKCQSSMHWRHHAFTHIVIRSSLRSLRVHAMHTHTGLFHSAMADPRNKNGGYQVPSITVVVPGAWKSGNTRRTNERYPYERSDGKRFPRQREGRCVVSCFGAFETR